jgi:hypothetical protein
MQIETIFNHVQKFQSFVYKSVGWIEPMKKIAKMLRRHRPLLPNWFKTKKQFSSGIVAGFNNKSKLTTKKAYGFQTVKTAEIPLYQAMGALPVPVTAYEFFLRRQKYKPNIRSDAVEGRGIVAIELGALLE